MNSITTITLWFNHHPIPHHTALRLVGATTIALWLVDVIQAMN